MPATEQTKYNLKSMHVVFGFSALIMLVSTLWMFAANQDREWKGYQRTFRNAEERLTKWQIQDQQSRQIKQQQAELEQQLEEAKLSPPQSTLYAAFKSEVALEAEQRGLEPFDFGTLDEINTKLEAASTEALAALEAEKQAAAEVMQARKAQSAAEVMVTESAADAEKQKEAEQALQSATKAYQAAVEKRREAEKQAASLVDAGLALRDKFLGRLTKIVDQARAREDEASSRRKFKSADLDAAKAKLDLLIRDERPQAEQDAQQQVIDHLKSGEGQLDDLTLQRQAAVAHRKKLQQMLAAMMTDVDRLQKQLADSRAEHDRLMVALEEREVTFWDPFFPIPGKRWLELPILDAFNSPLKIDNLWTDGNTLKYGSFSEVRRFDRCTTCHKGIDRTAPGSAEEPAYPEIQRLHVVMQTPETKPESADPEANLTIEEVYGFRISPIGMIHRNDVAVAGVEDRSLAAMASVQQEPAVGKTNESDVDGALSADVTQGLQVGDVIESINGDEVRVAADVQQFMITGAKFGTPITLTIRRGLPQPYASHPRLDLFVGSLSPHKLSNFACTSCHEGMGSATAFAFASHTPNTPEQAKQWASEHGWFSNPHWILPMYPQRFAESACLRCHHNVVELGPSERFPQPPAPKVLAGYNLINDYGCYGCHEINGYAGPNKRVGPDLRLEPNFSAAASTVKADPAFPKLDAEVQSWVETLRVNPEYDSIRRRLAEFLTQDAASDEPLLQARAQGMADLLQDVETPGQQRRVGPSLRYVKHKLSRDFLLDWIRVPSHFRPTTRMPQFFGLWDHLQEPELAADLELTQRYEQVELHALTTYLLDRSEPFDYTPVAAGAEPGSAERGKVTFEVRGCLACHQHADFPEIKSIQGPDLSNIGDKLSAEIGAPNGEAWLYSWLKNPNNYHARTRMPNLQLDPETNKDGKLIDPAADITAYLLSCSNGYKPDPFAVANYDPAAMDDLIMEYLSATFSYRDAEEYLRHGIPESLRSSLKGDEVELVGGATEKHKLMFVARKTISKYGCFACHDVPGFEGAKPIGTAIADWGVKEPDKLAWEHIGEYLHQGHHGTGEEHGIEAESAAHVGDMVATNSSATHEERSRYPSAARQQPHDPSEPFFLEQIAMQHRSGFLWQKLREPRSYDYRKTTNKKYTERLRMPLFPINPEQREQVVTFVLGLVATPPSQKFVYVGDPRQNAISEGLKVVEKYNCTGCHVLQAETWKLDLTPGEIEESPATPDFPFLTPHFRPAELTASSEPSQRRGTLNASVQGMPALDNADGHFMIWDEDWEPIDPEDLAEVPVQERFYPIQLWQPALIEGNVHTSGRTLGIPATAITERLPAFGGDLALYLLPRVTALEKAENPNANATESWGWVPPPLTGEGKKVEPDWLYGYLLDPYPIRPAVFLRMPKFNMSSDEATKLVNYFAAKDNVDYPFEYDPRKQDRHLARAEQEFAGKGDRLDAAMKIVTNANYCVKCHLVGDYMPEGNVRALAPNLVHSQTRLRPDYMKRWIANPLKILPYTPMPVNVTYDPSSPTFGGVDQALYPGTSVDQLNALVDLLANFGTYMTQKNNVADLVRQATEGAAKAAAETPEGQETSRVRQQTESR